MARLPIPGNDVGNWGQILNEYLSETLNSDGTLKNGVVTGSALSNGSVSAAKIADGTITNTQISASASISQSKIANLTTSLGSKADTSTTVSGAVSLTGGGDLSANRTLSLVNDALTPGSSAYYGTDGSGIKGFHTLPTAASQPLTIVTDAPYNADSTGTNDARAAIQQAIDDVATAGGGVVFLPAGKYRIDYAANAGYTGQSGGLQMKDSVILQGEGFATMLFANGTWSAEAGIVGIGDALTTRAVRQAQVRDVLLKGSDSTASHGTPVANRSGILFNTASISGEPDAVHRITNVWIWDTDRAVVFYGLDDQAIVADTIRIRWTRRQGFVIGHEDLSGGAGDNLLSNVDVSSHNQGDLGYAGFEIYGGNTHAMSCKAWYGRRGTAFTSGYAYKDGAGWYIGAPRFFGANIEAQDNGGHGLICRYGNVSIEGLILDSNSYYDAVTAPALTNECYGLYVNSGVSSLTVTGLNAFSRSPSHQDQKYGVYIDSASRNINISGTTKDNAAVQNTPTLADQVVWSGSPHATHLVSVGITADGTSSSVVNGYDVATGIYDMYKASAAQEVNVTGTTLTADANLATDVIGGNVRYQIEAFIMYRADAVEKAKFIIVPSIVSGTGTMDGALQISYHDSSDAAQISSAYLNSTGSNFVTANGLGHAAGGSTIRTVRITGAGYVGTNIVTGRYEVHTAEANGTSVEGVKILAGSWLKVHILS